MRKREKDLQRRDWLLLHQRDYYHSDEPWEEVNKDLELYTDQGTKVTKKKGFWNVEIKNIETCYAREGNGWKKNKKAIRGVV